MSQHYVKVKQQTRAGGAGNGKIICPKGDYMIRHDFYEFISKALDFHQIIVYNTIKR